MFRGHDTERERLVAVKLFKLDLPPQTTHQLVAGLQRLVAANLSHPAIATPVAAGLADVSAYLAMDYVAAESIDLAVRGLGPLPPADVLQVGARIASALDHAVAAGFTHGCLHPRDVLMTNRETRVTGIGVGQILAQLGVPVPVRRPYTAPERVDGQTWDRRADVFSLAAIVHELLWGKRVSGTGSQAVDGMTALPGGDLDALRRVFRRALAEDPGERHPTPKIFVEALKRALPDVAVDISVPFVAAPPPRNLRLAPSSRAPKDDIEPLLPLEQPRFVDVDVEPAPQASRQGPSILEDAPMAVEAKAPVTIGDEHSQDPFALSWLEPPKPEPDAADLYSLKLDPRQGGPEVEPLEGREPIQAAKPVREPEIVAPPAVPPPAPPLEIPKPIEPVVAAAPARPEKPAESKSVERHREEQAAERREPRESVPQVPIELTMLERSRSAVWPLMLALVIGGTLGFAGGYAVGVRDHPAALATTTPAGAAPAREFTEGTVPDTPKPAAPPEARPDASTPAAESTPASPAPRPAASAAAAEPKPAVPPPTRAAWTGGRLNIRSTPPGARVLVDEREAGRTPTAVRNLTEGPHLIRITRDGYAAHDRRIVITKERPAQLVTATLARQTQAARPAAPARPQPPPAAGGRGALLVDSRPAGARVFLDGKLMGTTPLSSPAVAAGDHTIRLEHDGYKSWTGTVRIVASEQARVTASMER